MEFIAYLNSLPRTHLTEAVSAAYRTIFEGFTPATNELSAYLNGLHRVTIPEGLDGMDISIYTLFAEHTVATSMLFKAGSMIGDRATDDDIARIAASIKEGCQEPGNDAEIRETAKECAREFKYMDQQKLVQSAKLYNDGNPSEAFNVLKEFPAELASLAGHLDEWWKTNNADMDYLTVKPDVRGKLVRNKWLVHGTTPESGIKIARCGFDRGNKLGMLAFNESDPVDGMQHDYGGNYLFAFDAEDECDWDKYGDCAVVFKGYGYKVYHSRDFEYQVIFDYHEPSGCFLIMHKNAAQDIGLRTIKFNDNVWKLNEYQIYGCRDGTPVPIVAFYTQEDCVNWILANGDQYTSMMFKWK